MKGLHKGWITLKMKEEPCRKGTLSGKAPGHPFEKNNFTCQHEVLNTLEWQRLMSVWELIMDVYINKLGDGTSL